MANNKYPLWLPKSSVRALIALGSLASGVGLYLYTGSVPEWLIATIGSATAFYFATRVTECK